MKMKVTVETPKSTASVNLEIKDEIPSLIKSSEYAEHFLTLALDEGIERGLYVEESAWTVTQPKKGKRKNEGKTKKSS